MFQNIQLNPRLRQAMASIPTIGYVTKAFGKLENIIMLQNVIKINFDNSYHLLKNQFIRQYQCSV